MVMEEFGISAAAAAKNAADEGSPGTVISKGLKNDSNLCTFTLKLEESGAPNSVNIISEWSLVSLVQRQAADRGDHEYMSFEHGTILTYAALDRDRQKLAEKQRSELTGGDRARPAQEIDSKVITIHWRRQK